MDHSSMYVRIYVIKSADLHRKGSEFSFNAADFCNYSANVRIFIEDNLTYNRFEWQNLVAQVQVRYMSCLQEKTSVTMYPLMIGCSTWGWIR